jgi:hypothetical protein
MRSAGVSVAMRITSTSPASVAWAMTRTMCSSGKMELARTFAASGSTPTVPLWQKGSPVS